MQRVTIATVRHGNDPVRSSEARADEELSDRPRDPGEQLRPHVVRLTCDLVTGHAPMGLSADCALGLRDKHGSTRLPRVGAE